MVEIPDVADPVSSDTALHHVLRLTTDWFTGHVAGRASALTPSARTRP
ncbi:hypothetical protein [Streptomyces hirsutus]|nr:hypothetical protein [Streptomyces hirsutus]